MKRSIAVILVLVGLGLGATVLHDAVPVSTAQQTPGPSPASQTAILPLNAKGARLQNEQNTIDIVKKYEPGLVLVSVTAQVPSQDPFAGMMGGGNGTQVEQGVGSGFFVDASGDILTNFHVVQNATSVTLRVQGRDQGYKARVVGLAPQYDLALVRPTNMPGELIKPIPLGDSSTLEVGQKAVAMGAPFGLGFTVTEGIVSAVNRSIPVGFQVATNGQVDPNAQGAPQRTIQTDAAINPGNSGGPLMNSAGQVIGLNTQILSPGTAQSGQGQSAGVGFAIPINVARNLLPRLKAANGGIVRAPTIGVSAGLVVADPQTGGAVPVGTSALTPAALAQFKLPPRGLVIGTVTPGSPAAAAGLKGGSQREQSQSGILIYGGDVITAVNGQPVDGLPDLQAQIFDKQPGDTLKLRVWRNGQTRDVNVKLTQASIQPAR